MSATFFEANPEVSLEKKALLSRYTTFQLGGECPGLIHCQTPAQLVKAVQSLHEAGQPFILIGGGSNLVVSDRGLDRYVIRYFSSIPYIQKTSAGIEVSASTLLDDLAKWAAAHGLEGINYASGIPGTVGGAVVGNAGAFGKQIGDVIKEVALLSKAGRQKKSAREALGFSYRHSLLKESDDIVVSATLLLKPGDSQALLKEREEILKVRHEKHPDLAQEPCAGSFFRNIEPTSQAGKRQAAGYFLEQAGGKDLFHGGARIFSKHANIIIRTPGCSAQDVYELSQKMQQLALKTFGLNLVREVRFVGEFHGMPEGLKDIIW